MPNRLYSAQDLPEFQSDEAGKIITSSRVFSAEIECYANDTETTQYIANTISKHVGITDDGSLYSNGIELQTPKLKGKNGEALVKSVCTALHNAGATVDKSTGLHIHLDGKGLLPRTLTMTNPIALKQLWKFYLAFDDVILSFLPKSRRGNAYCRPMKETSKYSQIHEAKSQRDLEILWYATHSVRHITQAKLHAKHSSRYHGINLHILLAEKHLEVRFHSGTVHATKILEWTALHQRICDMAASKTLVTSEAMLSLDLAQKTKMFFAILGLPDRAVKYFMHRQAEFAPKMIKVPATTYTRAHEEDVSTVSESDLEVDEVIA